MLKNKSILITGGSGLLASNWALSVCDDYAVTLLLHHKKISIKGIDTDIVFLDSLDDDGPIHWCSPAIISILGIFSVTLLKNLKR